MRSGRGITATAGQNEIGGLWGGANAREAISIHWRTLTVAAALLVFKGLTVARQEGADTPTPALAFSLPACNGSFALPCSIFGVKNGR